MTDEDLGGADVHCRISGVADHYAVNDEHALGSPGTSSRPWPAAAASPSTGEAPEEPAYDPQEIYGMVPRGRAQALRHPRRSSPASWTASAFRNSRSSTRPTLVCGFARMLGYPVGHPGNNGVLFSESSLKKGAHFIELCAIAQDPARLPPEHHRLHRRQAIRARRHRPGRREDGPRGGHAPTCPSSR